jgi:hypothetical protein
MNQNQQDLMVALGLDKLPEQEQAELYNRIGGVLFQGILIRAIESMTDEEQDALDAFLGEHPEDPDALMGYLQKNVANFEALVEDEVARFKASAMELMASDENKA